MYLGIDLGTSGVKVCVIGPDGAVIATAGAPLAMSHPAPGASEQDCRDWWGAVQSAVTTLPDQTRATLRAIGLSGQMHGAVLLDAGGMPLRPVMLWNDARADAECAAILAAEPGAGQIAGVLPMPGFPAPKMLWLARHDPDLHARIAHVLMPKDYIGFRLHGGHATDPSDAAGSFWFDEGAGHWSERLCQISATDPGWLPPVRHGNAVAGHLLPEAARALGLPPGLPVATGAGDAAAGAIGLGAVADGDGFISLGTSGQLFVTTAHYRPNPESRVHAYAHTLPGLWFQMAAMLNGARPMAWLAGLLRRPLVDLLAEAETETGGAPSGPLFLPYLTGERTPHGDADIRAGFALLGETTSQASLMRAVVEGIAFSFADAVAALTAVGPVPDTLLATGGGTRSDFVMQQIADATGRRIGRSDRADIAPALGAARLAWAATGTAPASDIMVKPPVERWFDPRPQAADRMSSRLAAYRAFYPAVKTVHDALR